MKKELSTLEILQKIKNNELTGKDLTRELRLEIVGHLSLLGWTPPKIATVIGYSDRQVQRFVQEFKKANQLTVTSSYGPEYVGYWIQRMEASIAFFTRTYNDPNQSMQTRMFAAVAGTKVLIDMTTKLQTLGYLPTHKFDASKLLNLQPSSQDQEANTKEAQLDPLMAKSFDMLHPMDRERLIEMYRKEMRELNDRIKTRENMQNIYDETKRLQSPDTSMPGGS